MLPPAQVIPATSASPPPHLEAWNATHRPFTARRIEQWFLDRASRQPDAPAVFTGSTTLSYQQLRRRAEQFAQQLRSRDVTPGEPIGVCMDRSPDLIAAVLGILLAGGCYVPIDPTWPAPRIAAIADRIQLRRVVVDDLGSIAASHANLTPLTPPAANAPFSTDHPHDNTTDPAP
jgi:non-ribosomal peptide synthetase component F